jgi:hypothetical protein
VVGKIGDKNMSFEARLEKRRGVNISVNAAELEQQRQEEENLQRIHDENRNHPVFQEMRKLASSTELNEALLAYYKVYKNRDGKADISLIDTYDSSLTHKDEEPFELVKVIMPISDPYEMSGGDAETQTVTDELTVTIRGVKNEPENEDIAIFSTVGRYQDDGSRGSFGSYEWDDILNNIADRIVRKNNQT